MLVDHILHGVDFAPTVISVNKNVFALVPFLRDLGLKCNAFHGLYSLLGLLYLLDIKDLVPLALAHNCFDFACLRLRVLRLNRVDKFG